MDNATKAPEALLKEATRWWTTSIIDIHPGKIAVRGYRIQELIGGIGFPEMIWLMLRGDLPSACQGELLEAALVAAVDHGPQAPSIAISRMATTCGLPINGAMASAINALDDVHGGAGEQCMQLIRRVEDRCRNDANLTVEAAVEAELDDFIEKHGKIVPGFGHRFHGTDPRAVRLLDLAEAARASGVISGTYTAIGKAIEAALCRRKQVKIPMNIDGVTAAIYLELGFAPTLGRGLFILSRSVGILAHAWEQSQQGGRIKGPMPPSIPYRYTGSALRHLSEEQPGKTLDAA